MKQKVLLAVFVAIIAMAMLFVLSVTLDDKLPTDFSSIDLDKNGVVDVKDWSIADGLGKKEVADRILIILRTRQ